VDKKDTLTLKPFDLACLLETSSGTLPGRTSLLSEDEASLQFPSLVFPNIRKPKIGSTGVLTLTFHLHGHPIETLKIPCRVAYVISILVGVRLNTQALNSQQHERYIMLLKSKH